MSDSSGSFSMGKLVLLLLFIAVLIMVGKMIIAVTYSLIKWTLVSLIILTVVGFAFKGKGP